LADSAPRARFFAAEALGRIAYQPAAAPIVAMLAANDDKDVYLRHAGSLALSRIGDAAALGALSSHPSRGVRIAAIVALRRLRSPEVARFVADSDDAIVLEAARAINDDGSIEAALPALARLLGDKRFGSEPLVRRAISANLKVGSAEALTRVATFAGDAIGPQALRVEAVAAMGVWTDPSPMDRVDGIYLGQAKPRDAAEAQAAVLRLMQSASIEDAPAMKIALADAAGRLGVQGAAPILLTQLRSDTSFNVRVAALKALQALKVSNMDEVMKIAVADADANVRRAALGVLPSLPLGDAVKVQNLTAVIRSGTVNDQQAGFEVLGTLKSGEAEKALASFFDELVAGKMAPTVQLDLVDAMQANGAPALEAKLDAYRKTKGVDTVTLAFRDALLQGGSVARGRDLFVGHPAAQCTRCHTVRNAGSDVGPNLTGVATRLTREQILESLLEPSARIAAGYGTVGITLKNGKRVDGTLKDETATHVVLLAGTPPVEQRIAKAEIAERTNPVSAMPPIGLIVKPRDVRDLVAYLGTLR
jgi:putative heme-binding domain-containing protein